MMRDNNTPTQKPQPRYDHLVPPANRALRFTFKVIGSLMTGLVRAALHLPGVMRKVGERHERKVDRRKLRQKEPLSQTGTGFFP